MLNCWQSWITTAVESTINPLSNHLSIEAMCAITSIGRRLKTSGDSKVVEHVSFPSVAVSMKLPTPVSSVIRERRQNRRVPVERRLPPFKYRTQYVECVKQTNAAGSTGTMGYSWRFTRAFGCILQFFSTALSRQDGWGPPRHPPYVYRGLYLRRKAASSWRKGGREGSMLLLEYPRFIAAITKALHGPTVSWFNQVHIFTILVTKDSL
jgi:hypothetical protein